MALNQHQNLRQQQRLSPQQLQLIKLLEYSVLEMEEKIKSEIEENPALEEGDAPNAEEELNEQVVEETTEEREDFSLEDYMGDDEVADYKSQSNNQSSEDKLTEQVYAENDSFIDALGKQLQLLDLTPLQSQLARYIVGNLDEDGYLRREVAQITSDLQINLGLEVEETDLYVALAAVQELDPAGVGARSLEECLLLQLQRKKMTDSIDVAMRILEECFLEFSNRHYEKIQSILHVSSQELKEAIEEIVHLNPKPGNSLSSSTKSMDAITPDFILENEDGNLRILLNNKRTPHLYVSPTYVNLFEDYLGNKKNQNKSTKQAVLFAKQKLDGAKFFINAVKQREHTLYQVMSTILEIQYAYFLEGDEALLKPMTMKDVAEKSFYDISTISRVANSKYIETDFGVFSLKYFFSEGLTKSSGEEVSTRKIKSFLKECIDAEEKTKPLSDEKLSELLLEKGYKVARRTVAKYREQLGIPVARLRKEI